MSIFFTNVAFGAPKVVVIGAGLAGLTTAYRLQEKGMDVDLYEARNRVGGRVFTVHIGGKPGELGGQNFSDGGDALNLCRLIDELELELVGSQSTFNHSYYFDGQDDFTPIMLLLKNKRFDPEALRIQIHNLIDHSRNMKEMLSAIVEEKDPLYAIMAVRLAAYEGAPIEQLSTFYADSLFHMLLGGICLAHPGNEENVVNRVNVKGGNGLLPEKIASKLGTRLHLNMPLVQVARELSSLQDQFVLHFKNGQTVKADILVLAIPCSVYENIVFAENVIPLDRLKAIQSVQYGTNAKLLIPFSNTSTKRIGLVNDQTINVLNTDQSILTAYYTGESSRFSSETILQSYAQIRPMIEKGFGDACPALTLPTFAEDRAFAAYDGPVGYSWPNDPYAKGSYSYISPGQEFLFTDISEEKGELFKTLFAPIGETLYFAGEHASILMDVPGTMEAACESGERAAHMILKRASKEL